MNPLVQYTTIEEVKGAAYAWQKCLSSCNRRRASRQTFWACLQMLAQNQVDLLPLLMQFSTAISTISSSFFYLELIVDFLWLACVSVVFSYTSYALILPSRVSTFLPCDFFTVYFSTRTLSSSQICSKFSSVFSCRASLVCCFHMS